MARGLPRKGEEGEMGDLGFDLIHNKTSSGSFDLFHPVLENKKLL